MPPEAERPVLLLVEDEMMIQEIIRDYLFSAGFEVATCSEATGAIAELELRANVYAAVITDIRLGSGLKGWDIAHRARELVPTMPIIYLTGDSAGDWAAQGVPGSVLLQKPFVEAQLLTAIANLLNRTTATDLN